MSKPTSSTVKLSSNSFRLSRSVTQHDCLGRHYAIIHQERQELWIDHSLQTAPWDRESGEVSSSHSSDYFEYPKPGTTTSVPPLRKHISSETMDYRFSFRGNHDWIQPSSDIQDRLEPPPRHLHADHSPRHIPFNGFGRHLPDTCLHKARCQPVGELSEEYKEKYTKGLPNKVRATFPYDPFCNPKYYDGKSSANHLGAPPEQRENALARSRSPLIRADTTSTSTESWSQAIDAVDKSQQRK